ncbi:flavin-containing monooxygenase [Nocardia concava]|uniref:flavin-containing monooxygenase n=1 Tax=Nocardia concava TaxID=257281 RepID=UPI0002DE0EFF|nr:NAD(P)/FAD-dependent oxidoreductase [Nocardia concava]
MTAADEDSATPAELHPLPDREVVIVGAGFGGLGAAIQLRKAGFHDIVLLEQADDLGGTWRDNTYPGVAVDVTSFTYSFSFEMNPDWSRAYAPGRELKAYADHCADKYDLRQHIRFRTEVIGSRWDEQHGLWQVELAGGGTVTARYLVAAVGILTQPKTPDILGLADFTGKTLHTARWDHDYDLTGKRVAVIGTGATSVQLVPAIAGRVAHLDVYQRTPIWVGPKPDARIPVSMRRAFRRVPGMQKGFRAVTTAATESVMTLGIVHNKQMPLLVKTIEQVCLANLRRQVPDPELRDKLTPRYGFGCKRPSFSNDYFRTFTRPDVELVTEGIEAVTETGVRTRDGVHREIDTLILATGFKVFERGNTPPFPIVGRGERELGQWWDEQRYQSYQGATMPGYPNLFLIAGPYGFTGGSYFQLIENQSRHVVRCLSHARSTGAAVVEVSARAHARYFDYIQRRQPSTVFYSNICAASNSYYFDKHGDSPILRPSSAVEAWWDSRFFDLRDYEFRSPTAQPAVRAAATVGEAST